MKMFPFISNSNTLSLLMIKIKIKMMRRRRRARKLGTEIVDDCRDAEAGKAREDEGREARVQHHQEARQPRHQLVALPSRAPHRHRAAHVQRVVCHRLHRLEPPVHAAAARPQSRPCAAVAWPAPRARVLAEPRHVAQQSLHRRVRGPAAPPAWPAPRAAALCSAPRASTPSVSRSVRCSTTARPPLAHRRHRAHRRALVLHRVHKRTRPHTLFPTQHSHFIVQ